MLNAFGVLNSLGYGVFTRGLLNAYDQHVSKEIAYFPTPLSPVPEDDQARRWMQNALQFKKSDPGLMIFQIPWLNQFCGKPMIGFPIFELDELTEGEVAILKGLDVILQSSSWGEKVLGNHGFNNVEIVPGGYDPAIYRPVIDLRGKKNRMEKQGVTFVHVGKFESRKSSGEILRSFSRATQGIQVRVTFCFHSFNPFDADWFKKIAGILGKEGFSWESPNFIRDQVKIMVPAERFQSHPAKLYQMADFGIWASKAEGWNLPLLECLACGVPCITTDTTAQGEFIRRGIYPEKLLLTNRQQEPTRVGGQWWSINEEELMNKIRAILEDPVSHLELSDACLTSMREFTWEHAARKLGKIVCRT